jgi:diaminopimelate decarboxylase
MDRRDFFKLGITSSILSSLPLINSVHAGDDAPIDYPVSDYFNSLGPFELQELTGLVKKYGTPLYVYDQNTIEKNYREFESAFKANYPNVKIHYAFKANTNIKILKVLRSLGAEAECISEAEIRLGEVAGYKKENTLFTSSSKSESELSFAVKNKVLINLDSIPDLKNLIFVVDKLKIKARVTFRINPDVNPNTHRNISTGHKLTKFGILQDDQELLFAYKTAHEHPLIEVLGVHSHIGSQILEVKPFLENVEIVTRVARKVKEHLGLELKILNLGGGLGIPYRDGQVGLSPMEMAKTICPILKEKLKDFKQLPELHLEPGRYFVAQAGMLLTRVNSVKLNPLRNFINVDTGFNHLARPLLYQAHHRVRILGKDVDNKTATIFQVAGNICETGDILAYERKLPVPEVGDTVAFLDVGAYGFSMSSEYNSFSLPAEVLKTNGKFQLIRRRGRFADLLRGQINS